MNLKRIALMSIGIAVGFQLVLLLGGIAWYWLLNSTIVSSREPREYLLYVPPSDGPTRPTPPLVISMYGTALWPAKQRDISHGNTVADAHGFIVVYPISRVMFGSANDGIDATRPIRRFFSDHRLPTE